jgi:hypothetical protein
MGAILHEVVTPDMVGPFCSQPDAGSVIEPQTTAFGLFGGNFQPLPSPDPLDPLVIHDPTGSRTQEFCDLAVAVTTVLAGEINDVGREPLVIVSPLRNTPLRRTMLSEHAADPPLGQLQLGSNVIDAGPATGGAYQFPEAASFKISLSKLRSATARRSRAFSASRSFRRLT